MLLLCTLATIAAFVYTIHNKLYAHTHTHTHTAHCISRISGCRLPADRRRWESFFTFFIHLSSTSLHVEA
jgi:hypothetical protein